VDLNVDLTYQPFGEMKIAEPTIGDVVTWMCKLAWQGKNDTKVRNLAEVIVRPLQSGDYTGEVGAVQEWMCDHFRYVLDPRGQEFTRWPQGQFESIYPGSSAPRMQEDCDGQAVFSAALLQSIGHRCFFALASFDASGIPGHVFTVVDARGKGMLVVDAVAGSSVPKMLREMTSCELVPVEYGVDAPIKVDTPFKGWSGWKP
jgi:hypothetical protein